MDAFFKAFDEAKEANQLSRIVKIDMEECSIRVYCDDRLIIYANGDTAERDSVYLDAALKLEAWTKLMGDMENGEHLYRLRKILQTEDVESADML